MPQSSASRILFTCASVILTLVLPLGCARGDAQALSKKAAPLAAQSQPTRAEKCEANPRWITNPAMPMNVEGTSPCSFHQFSWRDFLYLTQSKGDKPEFQTWMTVEELFAPSGTTPPPWGTRVRAEKEANWPMAAGAPPAQVLRLGRIAKSDGSSGDFATKSILEAGSSQPLVDQNGRWIHFLEQVNKAEYDYISHCELYKKGCFDTGGTNISLPEQSIELKTSWRVMETCDLPDSPPKCKPEDRRSFHTARALVQPYNPEHPGPVLATVGLVGMHVVHKIPGHPEWIWATFEHRNTAPDCSARASAHTRPWLLYNPNCTGNYCTENIYCDPCSGKCSAQGGFDPQCTKPAIPTQTCRVHPIETLVKQLNASVHSLLPSSSVWRNYELIGTVYKAGGETGGPDSGTLMLSNMTMETYDQNAVTSMGPPPAGTGCFNCHTSGFFPSTGTFAQADFSHIFRQSEQGGGCSAGLPSFCPAPASPPAPSGGSTTP